MNYIQIWLLLWQSLFGQSIPFPGPGRAPISTATIAYDTSVDGSLVNPGTSLTWSHTTSGSNRILWVGAFGDTLIADPTCAKITGVTYNAVAMTQLPTVSPVGTPADRCVYLFYLIAPATGANNVVVSASSSIVIKGLSASYTGAKQSGVPDASANNTGTSVTSITTSVTVVAANSWTILVGKNSFGAPVAGTGSTQRQNANDFGIFDSNGPLAAGSRSMQLTIGTSSNFGVVMASFAPL